VQGFYTVDDAVLDGALGADKQAEYLGAEADAKGGDDKAGSK
jgi:hypothetical protein